MQNPSHALLAPGLTISQWHPSQTQAGEEARTFCLSVIKDTYGYDYRPDWHADLDSFAKGEESRYSPANGGAFFIIRNHDGEIIGTGGIYSMVHKPNFIELFGKQRYGDVSQTACMGRTYLKKEYRGNALSRTLVPMLEMAAKANGYTRMSLDCEASADRLRRHWESFGFTDFLIDGPTAFYDKRIQTSS
ncbi:MAG: GNAT family N-acetyltransferase [Blastochloris viridis]|uniref:GNAT family N-acetyltransferase n=1 Tax=Blastochloris viridis TaxID=1079 RepID=A0A6N4R9C4_BLAVI|nr:MAG: GNAT family N-acetyltransferase [Blastochloris viridis]